MTESNPLHAPETLHTHCDLKKVPARTGALNSFFPSETLAFRAIGLRTVPRCAQRVDTPIGTSREVQGVGRIGLTGVGMARIEDARRDVIFASPRTCVTFVTAGCE